jgi:phage terminase large subunit
MPKSRGASVELDLLALFRRKLNTVAGEGWPAKKWQRDPIGFVHEVLRVETLLPHQEAIILAVAFGDPDRAASIIKVAVRSGQKTGKTMIAVCLALWFYACFEDARIYLTANAAAQIRRVLWKELGKRKRVSGVPGHMSPNPETGMHAADGREILGFTVKNIESMAGLSGENQLVIADEASALEQSLAEAIEGNLSSGGRMLWISNPTRGEGPFFDSFHSRADYWITFAVDAEDVAQWQRDNGVKIPGMATMSTLDQWRDEYGETHPFWFVRVKGDFLRNESGKIVPYHLIDEAKERWPETPDDEGPLSLGVDPAGPGDGGDESNFTLVRGKKLLALFCFRGLSEDAHIEHTKAFVSTYRRGDEDVRVVVDSEGPIGSALYGRLRAEGERLEREKPAERFSVFGVKASGKARRKPEMYDRVREELFAGLAQWFVDGGAIPPDPKLEKELYAPSWSSTVQGKLKATHKDLLREALGRSPDRLDGLALAVWEPAPWLLDARGESPAVLASQAAGAYTGRELGDAYDQLSWMRDAG